ncbi:MAG: FAD binding domain-containing protein [Rhodococcus sp. (in: high G+C Gram-positive bacteria)]
MDLNTVREVVRARSRDDLGQIDAETALVAGGTWIFSEPQVGVRRLVDLSELGWAPITISETGVEIAATCTVQELAQTAWPQRWPHVGALVALCVESLLASWKVQQFATVGGNIALGLPAGSMTSLCAGLDGMATLWTPDGSQRYVPVAELVTGCQQTSIGPGEVLRSLCLEDDVLRSRIACRRISLAPRGRSGAVVVGRVDAHGSLVLTVTAATDRPVVLRADTIPRDAAGWVAENVPEDAWFDDVHGAPDWRRHVSGRLAQDICEELS